MPNLETGLSVWVCDMDYASMYPSIMRAINTSRMTMTFAPYEIEGRDQAQADVRRYFSNLVNVKENTVTLNSEFNGLPSYTTIIDMIQQHLGGG